MENILPYIQVLWMTRETNHLSYERHRYKCRIKLLFLLKMISSINLSKNNNKEMIFQLSQKKIYKKRISD